MNVDFVTAIKIYFANYVNFKGRSTRADDNQYGPNPYGQI